ncbi:MAG TPA: MFS transporter [Bacteriovoracaceae bacterium]|nr:MFS transporter [Bacteriovoracaceae bacterium]
MRTYLQSFQNFSHNVKIFLLGNALVSMGVAIYGLLFNLYLKHMGLGEAMIGNLISTTSLGIAFMAIPAAFIIERFHVKHLVIFAMTLSSLFYGAQVLSHSVELLFNFGLIASMFMALFNITIAPFYLRNSTPQERIQLFTLNSCLGILAQFIGYLMGGYIPSLVRGMTSFQDEVTVFKIGLMFSIALIFIPNLMFLKITKVEIPKARIDVFQSLRDQDWSIIGKLTLPKLCFAFGAGLVIPFMNIYLKEKFSLSTNEIGLAFSLLQFFIFVGIFITPWFMKRTTQLRFILLTSLISIPFMISMGVVGNLGMVLSCFFVRGMLMNMSSPITSMFEMEKVKEKECVFASAMILFSYHLVYTISTRIGGYIIEKFSFGPTFYLSALSYITAVVLYYKFFKLDDVTNDQRLPHEDLTEIAS